MRNFMKWFIPYGFIVFRKKIRQRKKEKIESITFMNVEKVADANISDDIFQINRSDYEAPIYLRSKTTDLAIYQSIIHNDEYNFVVRKEPKFIIDAGANIGMASVYFAKKYPDAKIIAIEPEGENYKMLKRNTGNYKNISTINAALWDMSGEVNLFGDTGDSTSTLGYVAENDRSTLTSIYDYQKIQLTKAITVEEIILQFNIDSIDIFKIDIEGSEKEVFESCENWINKTNSIIIELHERIKIGCNRAFYNNVKYFQQIGKRGENIFLSKDNYIKMIY